MADNPHLLPHFLLRNSAREEPYINPTEERPRFRIAPRNRKLHGEALKTQLEAVAAGARSIISSAPTAVAVPGVYVEFESAAGYPLKVESLHDRKHGLELVSVSPAEDEQAANESMRATVLVRDGNVDYVIEKVDQYLTQETPKGKKPRNQQLVANISKARLATVRSLWSGTGKFPALDKVAWWEAWLRRGNDEEDRIRILEIFRTRASEETLPVSRNAIFFPETTVILVSASARQLNQHIFPLNILSELRMVKETASFFTSLKPPEQADWVREASERVLPPRKDAPAVCLLDTGVYSEHPLIKLALDPGDMASYNPDWGKHDHHGHGTEMAGLSLYGDLVDFLASREPATLTHKLESVKILPPLGYSPNSPPAYGSITWECITRAEVNAPTRPRVICLTITADDSDRGKPSSWSAAIDQVCAGVFTDDGTRRLVLISAGNINLNAADEYPDRNGDESIQDPAQAWNALTVGAFTEKDSIDHESYPGWRPLAPRGGLSPCSTTSKCWQVQWPYKPDIVLEGGNTGINPATGTAEDIDSLRLLSTGARPKNPLLVATGDTSGATALASRMCALIMAQYPAFWPETVRGLIVHSATWAPEMTKGKSLDDMTEDEVQSLLRVYGYGVPDLGRALYSARNSLTMVAQETMKPFTKDSGEVKTNILHLHKLPWPREALLSLPAHTDVEMRVTLSYFVEPKPERKGFGNKYRYMSHGLRFAVKSPTESSDGFRRRVNKVARAEVEKYEPGTHDSLNWLLGRKLRARGSLHSDIWRGTAAQLAEKDHVIIYPINGWWKYQPHLEKWDREARYSLIVTISAPGVDVDIYTPMATGLVLV